MRSCANSSGQLCAGLSFETWPRPGTECWRRTCIASRSAQPRSELPHERSGAPGDWKQRQTVVRERMMTDRGRIAQVVERQTENLGVGGSTPSPATDIANDYRW